MSISSALSNALSGLTVSSRAADVVASNVSNAMTDGYGVRELDVASRVIGNGGGGARVVGVTRFEDAQLTGSRRRADADLAARQVFAGALGRIEAQIGTPDLVDSLSARTATFEARLIAAANTPQSEAGLSSAVDAAVSLARKLGTASDGIQAERLRADNGISDAVTDLNAALQSLADLNDRLRTSQGGGRDISSLLDAQAQLVDRIAPLVPLTTRRDEYGSLQVFSREGDALLDGRAARFDFTPVSIMIPEMTLLAGDLSGLSMNGSPVDMDGPAARLQGGSLAAMFEMRDRTGVASQARLDAVARDLAERFQTPGLDPTLAPGDPGLFTDSGIAVAPGAELGLSSRLTVNATVDPARGGETWRLRDGLSAAVAGPPARSDILTAKIDALAAVTPTASAAFFGVSRNFSDLVSENVSLAGIARQNAEADLSGIATQQASLRQSELALGVDTDAEMRRLLQIEQSFAANARVITAAEEMIDELLRI